MNARNLCDHDVKFEIGNLKPMWNICMVEWNGGPWKKFDMGAAFLNGNEICVVMITDI